MTSVLLDKTGKKNARKQKHWIREYKIKSYIPKRDGKKFAHKTIGSHGPYSTSWLYRIVVCYFGIKLKQKSIKLPVVQWECVCVWLTNTLVCICVPSIIYWNECAEYTEYKHNITYRPDTHSILVVVLSFLHFQFTKLNEHTEQSKRRQGKEWAKKLRVKGRKNKHGEKQRNNNNSSSTLPYSQALENESREWKSIKDASTAYLKDTRIKTVKRSIIMWLLLV